MEPDVRKLFDGSVRSRNCLAHLCLVAPSCIPIWEGIELPVHHDVPHPKEYHSSAL